ncbi:MBL fold metallo-hydrolase [Kutzneria kofuensis]|uniref:Glyoxylase-like metal-dependent hydrolase (Beta-lactamase superfamily II) n=1 Tax=Kutzneria kofuensis TaxID=103725 RepID=A0A7W9NG60_9PSEU|nr:MBL fold metallo-hydrolase [Kutzneria kofuensis]MBB5890841.1 glyoxylase-like metal-dependent hydrolase (beta-lactamase superfamily II) [Kutzneria kofuensis]
MSARWIEVADGVHVRRHEELDLSLGLVVGDDACLVVDTGGDEAQGAEWAAAVRAVTPLPWTVVLTHAHFDHAFGTQAFLPCPVLAHPNCVDELVVEGAEDKDKWAAHYDAQNQPEIAANIRATRIALPNTLVSERTAVDLGGRTVEIAQFGRGHTDHDLVLRVPDADVVFAGDLVENGAPPAFEGSFPASWPTALAGLLDLTGPDTVVVPGHGEPVDAAFVAAQRAEIAAVVELTRALTAGSVTLEDVFRDSPFPAEATRRAIGRLTGRNRSAR